MAKSDRIYREMNISGRSMGRRRRWPRWALAPSLDAYAQARGLSKSETLRELLTIGLAAQVATLAKGGAR